MKRKDAVLIFVTAALIIGVLAAGPIPQDRRYHEFADQRTLFGLVNGWNVLSNVLFVLLGAWGALFTYRLLRRGEERSLLTQYLLFFAAIFLTGLGSGYYHHAPSNTTLLWDRLPMSVAFMALLTSVISECIDRKAGAFLLVPFLLLGIMSVLYWAWTEKTGQGDLRPYGIVQFLPVLLIPLMLILYKPAATYSVPVWSLSALYALAKGFEIFDRQVYAGLGFISGHTIKHILAALGTGAVLKMLHARGMLFASQNTAQKIKAS